MNDTIVENNPYFDRQTSSVIKGVALIMMFVHHFFTFPGWWGDGISYPLIEKYAPYFCEPFKLCVSIFCFITGYFYFYNKSKTYRYAAKKITDLLITYWAVFLIFAVLAVTLAGQEYSLRDIIIEAFAIKRPTMKFCWYVYFYLAFMLILPLLTRIMSKRILLDHFVSFLLVPFVIELISTHVGNDTLFTMIDRLANWFPVVLVGYIFAAYNIFEKIEHCLRAVIKCKWVHVFFAVIVAAVVPMGRFFEPKVFFSFSIVPAFYLSLDVIYTPIFIYCISLICKELGMLHLKKIVAAIGKYSLYMWFVSCLFFGNSKEVFQPILYFPHNPVLVTIWGLMICYAISYVLDLGVKKILQAKNRVFFKE